MLGSDRLLFIMVLCSDTRQTASTQKINHKQDQRRPIACVPATYIKIVDPFYY